MKINESLGFILGVTSKKLKHHLMDILKEYNLTTSQWSVLKLLCEKDNMTQVEIAKNFKTDKMTIGGVVDKLISKNLIERKRSTTDRRSYYVYILDEGKRIVSIIEKYAVDINEKALSGFTESEVEQFKLYLERINKNFEGEN